MKIFVNLLVVLVMVVGSRMAMALPIFDINLTPENGSITGTIETDGTLGTLGLVNVLDYSLMLDDGIDTLFINSGNSSLFIGGPNGPSQLSATATELLFNFSGTASNIEFGAFTGGELWLLTLWSQPSPGDGSVILQHFNIPNDHVQLDGPIIGTQTVGTVQSVDVPGPATLALFGLGLAGLGFIRRKRQIHG